MTLSFLTGYVLGQKDVSTNAMRAAAIPAAGTVSKEHILDVDERVDRLLLVVAAMWSLLEEPVSPRTGSRLAWQNWTRPMVLWTARSRPRPSRAPTVERLLPANSLLANSAEPLFPETGTHSHPSEGDYIPS